MRYKKFLSFTLLAAGMLTMVGCSDATDATKKTSQGFKGEKLWKSETKEHKNFKDLGNYVIELPDYTDASVQAKGLALINDRLDHGEMPAAPGGCTSMAKLNKKGEVIIGRNMDLTISQDPAYVYRTTYGKYKNFCVTYSPGGFKHYADIQQMDELPEQWLCQLIYSACDCFNEKGLYIEYNQREPNEALINYGLHSAHGDKTRPDGKPWERVCIAAITQLVSQNCATVKEAIEYIKNSYDWYTPQLPKDDPLAHYSGWNFSCMIGDATGEFGIIEIAQDEVSYIPYQYGQANFYITPKWTTIDYYGTGMGRLDMVSKVIGDVETIDDAMKAMEPIMWRNESLWIAYAERKGSQVLFKDDKGNPALDWRGDYVAEWPVLNDGRLVISKQIYDEAVASTYDPKIKEYYDEAIKLGHLVVDNDGTLMNCQPGSEAYNKLRRNMDNAWVHDPDNFEALKARAYGKLHTRYNEKGEFDPNNSSSMYEKLIAFFGMGVEKNEKPFRDAAGIWSSSVNSGINCAQKEMKVRFWENNDIVYHVKW